MQVHGANPMLICQVMDHSIWRILLANISDPASLNCTADTSQSCQNWCELHWRNSWKEKDLCLGNGEDLEKMTAPEQQRGTVEDGGDEADPGRKGTAQYCWQFSFQAFIALKSPLGLLLRLNNIAIHWKKVWGPCIPILKLIRHCEGWQKLMTRIQASSPLHR